MPSSLFQGIFDSEIVQAIFVPAFLLCIAVSLAEMIGAIRCRNGNPKMEAARQEVLADVL